MNKRILAMCLVLVVSLIGLNVVLRAQAPASGSAAADRDGLEDRIVSTVREPGELLSSVNVELRSEVPGQNTILSVAAEGSSVRKGDVLVVLDSSAIEDQINQQKIAVSSAIADLAQADTSLNLAQADREEFKAIKGLQEKAAALAKTALLGKGGELDTKLAASEAARQTFAQRLQLAEGSLQAWKNKKPDQAIPPEIQLAITEARSGYETASRQSKLVREFERPRAEAALALEQGMARFDVRQKLGLIESQVTKSRAELDKAKLAHAKAKYTLDRLLRNLAKCEIRAPQDGTVVHANVRSSRGAADFVLEPGAQVRERQTLILLPDLSKLHLRTLVNETRIPFVKIGQPAAIRFDAAPNKVFRGRVKRINRYAEPTSWLNEAVKQYAVSVDLIDPPEFARLGMSAVVEIAVRDSSILPAPSKTDTKKAAASANVQGLVRQTFKQYDKNSDAVISKIELIGLTEDRQKRILLADANKDDKITEAELIKHMSELLKRFSRQRK